MKMKTTDPVNISASVNSEEIQLPKVILEHIEKIARCVHDVWAGKRAEDGWRYGPVRDDIRKLHPGLVPYEELSEEEKSYDRQTAIATLKAVVALGYTLTHHKPDSL
jgi:hypothetical protein